MKDENLYEVAITAIVKKAKKFLITRRALTKKRWPGKWTVPGGKLDPSDYANLPQDVIYVWYNILEHTIKREVKEETGIVIKNVTYLCSLLTHYPGTRPSLVISCIAQYSSGKVKLQLEETDQYAWVTLDEAKKYDLIGGIIEELEMAQNRKLQKTEEWERHIR